MKKEIYYCDKCGEEIKDSEYGVNFIKIPELCEMDKNNEKVIRRFKRWRHREICNECMKLLFDMFNK